MSNLTILNTAVRQLDNLFSLNDLHRLSGGESKHQPTFFVRLDTTQELVAEIQQQDPNSTPLKTINGGCKRGTYACEELVIAYAMWISPKFHLVVLRAFLAMHKGENLQNSTQIAPVAEPKIAKEQTREQWLRLASLWFICYNNLELLNNLWKPLEALGSPFAVKAYTHVSEYQMSLGVMQRQLLPLLAEFEVDPREDRHFHHALKTMREYQPRGLGRLVKV